MPAEYPNSDPFASQTFNLLRDFVLEAQRVGVDACGGFEHFERELHQRMMAIEADLVAQQLAHYDVEAEEVEVHGEPFRFKMKWKEQYCGLAGTFSVERSLYVPRRRAGKAICPLEIRAGIVEGCWTPLAARLMSRAVAATTPKEAEELFAEWGGMKPSSSSLDRLPKAISEKWEADRQLFENELRNQEQIPREAVAVGVSIDGVLVPMKDGDREEKRSQGDKQPQGPAGYKEAGCGTVSFYDAEGNRLQTVRYARMPEHKKVTLKSELEAELQSIFSVRPDLELVMLADGAEDNWEFLEALPRLLGRERDPDKEAVDLFHVLERVKKALDAYHGEDTSHSRSAFEQMRIWLREEEDGAEHVIRALRYRRDASNGSAKSVIAAQIKYFENRKERMRYKKLLDQNLPVGSGVVEAACKTLATERMKRSGMSWRQEGGQAILTLRSLIQSDRWDYGWQLIMSQYRGLVTITKEAA
jgi:hypothetical protein